MEIWIVREKEKMSIRSLYLFQQLKIDSKQKLKKKKTQRKSKDRASNAEQLCKRNGTRNFVFCPQNI